MTRTPPPGSLRRRSLLQALGVAALRGVPAISAAAGLGSFTSDASAVPAEITNFEVTRDEDGVYLGFSVDFELGHGVEEALMKSVPLFFVAEVEIFRDRWYWRDRRVAHAVRTWRIVYQPLTSTYRVTTVGGLSQSFTSRSDALTAISRAARWKIAEPGQIDEGARHYLEFQYRLETAELPRPMQIGISGEPDWQLSVKRTLRLH